MRLAPRTPGKLPGNPHQGDSTSGAQPAADDREAAFADQRRSGTVIQDLDGLHVRRNDALRILVINESWLQFSQLEYLVLLPLLEYFKQYVSSATLLQAAYGCSYEPREARRLAKVMHRIRPKLAPYDLIIDTVISTSYRPWGYILQRATTRDAIQAFPRPQYPC